MRIKLILSLASLIVGLFVFSVIVVHPGPAIIGSILTWILIFLLFVVFPAEKLSSGSYSYFSITLIGCFVLPLIVYFTSPDHMYYVYKVNNVEYLWIKYFWEIKWQIILFAVGLFIVATFYKLFLSHNKKLKTDGLQPPFN